MPADVPLGRLPAEIAAKYAAQLQKVADTASEAGVVILPNDANAFGVVPDQPTAGRKQLVGAANLKAQLYGPPGSRQEAAVLGVTPPKRLPDTS